MYGMLLCIKFPLIFLSSARKANAFSRPDDVTRCPQLHGVTLFTQ